jgi:hypothetical protein
MAVRSPYAPGGMYGTNTSRYPVSVRPAPKPVARPPVLSYPGLSHPGKTADDQATYGYAPTIPRGPTYGAGSQGFGGGAPSGHWVTPDYSGILGSFTADARARFGAGLEAMKAQRLSQAKAAINKLGIRDVPGMLEKLQAFGLTQADLQGAADNPWSELKALDQQKRVGWNNAVAGLAARGGFRSGATIGARENIDQTAARNEAQVTQQTLSDLSEGLFNQTEWERQQRDAMEQSIAQQQSSLAAAYQPYWAQD